MNRFKLTLEYDGTAYAGWQRQNDVRTVQQAVEEALARFIHQDAITLMVAGRTDAGVHATGQVAHVDIARDIAPFRIMEAANHHLKVAGEAVSVLNVEPVGEDFHARFSAKERHYLYRILRRRAHSPLSQGRVWHLSRELDLDAMRQAGDILIGTHDFTSFRSTDCVSKSPVKTLNSISIEAVGEEVHCRFSSRSFMYNQIRITVGTLVRFGLGDWEAPHMRTILEARDRTVAGQTAPAEGLYFTRVDY